jgi:hypothetical protein
MSLRTCKAGLRPQQQIMNNTFRLHKPKRKHAESFTNGEEQIGFNDIATISLEENNLLSNLDKNELSVPLLNLHNVVELSVGFAHLGETPRSPSSPPSGESNQGKLPKPLAGQS